LRISPRIAILPIKLVTLNRTYGLGLGGRDLAVEQLWLVRLTKYSRGLKSIVPWEFAPLFFLDTPIYKRLTILGVW
jgi:hypothetical protein